MKSIIPPESSNFAAAIRFGMDNIAPPTPLQILSPLPFGGGSVLLSPSSRSTVVSDPCSGVTIMLHGEVFFSDPFDRQRQAEIVLTKYLSIADRNEFACSLNGHFILLIIDRGRNNILAITDRLGFRKLFFRRIGNTTYLASSPSLIPSNEVDPVGALTYLSNSFIFSGRTVRAEVRVLARATVHEISAYEIRASCYWEYNFPGAEQEPDMNASFPEYAALMREAVQRRIPKNTGRIFVSLSGGIDSRSVLGCLMEAVEDRSRLIAFSYGASQDADVIVASQVAQYAGIEHKVIQFSGSLFSTIINNAALGEGLVSFYTHGIDSIIQLAGDFTESDVLFFGDLAVQRGEKIFKNLDDVLVRGMEINSPITVPSYYSLGKYQISELQQSVDQDLIELKSRCAYMSDLQDIHDYLFLDQRTSNMLLPWREFLAGRFITVCDPFLDNNILDFYRDHPRAYRYNKSMHRYATERMFPQLVNIGFGKSGVDNTLIHKQIVDQYVILEKLCNGFPSLLDDLLPPDLIATALLDTYQRMKLQSTRIPLSLSLFRLVDKLHRRNLTMRLSKSMGSKMKEAGIPQLGAQQIERWLALRVHLADL